ncbi:MAG TPA: hypothetical protein VEK36_02280 [Candidatus Paceibacterota bacterium]|nr:hypothetical protein [Candidatus Paceibacterota bacterium]
MNGIDNISSQATSNDTPTASWRNPARLAANLYGLLRRYREEEKYHAYYAVPVLIGFTITYSLIQLLTYLFPDFSFHAQGYHIHHYTYGIAILLIFGYIGLWTRSLKVKYFCALAHGAGAAFIIDEAWLWFTLDPTIQYRDYDLAVFVGALLLGLILAPLFFNGKKRSNGK